MENKKNTIGLVGFILSLLSMFTCGVTSIISLILSIVGLNEAKKCNDDRKGMCLAGIIISSVMIFVLFILIVFGFSVGDLTKNENKTNNTNSSSKYNGSNNSSSSNSTQNNVKSNSNTFGLGDTFTFDGLELTLDDTYSFATIENSFSEYNGQSVIKIGVSVKNTSSEKHSLNMFFYELFGSQGTELDSITSYFDDNIDYAGDLKPGASYKSNFYILYDGDGEYSIDFDNYSQEVSVEFKVKK